MKVVILSLAMMAWGLASAVGAEADRQVADEAAIREAVESYVAAFNQGDAKALAAMWSPEAVYTDPFSGEQVFGREAIEKQFAAIFAEAKGAKLEATTDAIQFVSPNVAVEQGTAKVIRPDQAPEETVRPAPAAPPGNHLRNQPAFPGRSPRQVSRRQRPPGPHVAD